MCSTIDPPPFKLSIWAADNVTVVCFKSVEVMLPEAVSITSCTLNCVFALTAVFVFHDSGAIAPVATDGS